MPGSLRLSRLPRLALLRQARFRALVSSGHLHGCVGCLLRSRLSCCGRLSSSLILRLRDASAEASSRRDIPDCAWGDRLIRFAHHDDPRSSWRGRSASSFVSYPRLGAGKSRTFPVFPASFRRPGQMHSARATCVALPSHNSRNWMRNAPRAGPCRQGGARRGRASGRRGMPSAGIRHCAP